MFSVPGRLYRLAAAYLFIAFTTVSPAQVEPPSAPPLEQPSVRVEGAPALEPQPPLNPPAAPATRADVGAALAGGPSGVGFEESKSVEEEKPTLGTSSILRLLRQANPMMWPLVLCSIVTVGVVLERLFVLRRGRLAPRDFVDRFLDRLSAGKLDKDRAAELCRASDSVAGRLFGRAVHHWGQPPQVVREMVAQDAAGELVDLKRHVRILNGTATLAPLLGLLGTVVGLIEAFDALSGDTGGIGKNEALAHGISLALMATAFGLSIAIVSVAAYYFFLNRIDSLSRSLEKDLARVADLVSGEPQGSAVIDHRRPHPASASELARAELRGH